MKICAIKRTEKSINTRTSALSQQQSAPKTKSKHRGLRRLFKRSRKRMVRYGLLAANLALLGGVVAFVTHTPASSNSNKQNALTATTAELASPLDELSSADIAVHVAQLANLQETRSVANNADTVNAQLSITPSDEKVIAKPQVVATALKSRRDIAEYTVKEGDTITTIATKFGITSDSIRWSNGITGDIVSVGKKLTIPPITGIVYTVKEGDTPQKLAERYRVDKEQIIAFNDAEVDGLPVGEKIVIPEGIKPLENTFSGAYTGFWWGRNAPVYSGNGYDYGWCTWWAAHRRIQIGKPIPSNLGNAITWVNLASASGLSVGSVPQTGAVIWTNPATMSGYFSSLGHVGFVEKVNPDGSVWVSDMNSSGYASMDTNSYRTGGWNRISYRLLTAEQARSYRYIY